MRRQGTNNTITTLEDTAYTFGTLDFGFSDPADSPANTSCAVKITTLPGAGSLTDNGVAVTPGHFITAVDIAGGKLMFTPAANANGAGYASFTFQVQDDGGIANGGVDLDPTARTITVNVTAVNDAPQGTDRQRDHAGGHGLHLRHWSDFGFSDAADTPANAFSAVKISTLPGAGSLTCTRARGQRWADRSRVADISAGNLSLHPGTPTPTGRATRASASRCKTTGAQPTAGWTPIPARAA